MISSGAAPTKRAAADLAFAASASIRLLVGYTAPVLPLASRRSGDGEAHLVRYLSTAWRVKEREGTVQRAEPGTDGIDVETSHSVFSLDADGQRSARYTSETR